MQPHQNHEVLMPGRAHTVGRITASRLFLTPQHQSSTSKHQQSILGNTGGTVTALLRHGGFKANAPMTRTHE